MQKIMITGASGFVGQQLSRELLDRGYAIAAFDVKPLDPQLLAYKNCTYIQGNILKPEDLDRAAQGAQAVIHLAAAIRSTDYQHNYDINVQGTRNVVAVCKKLKIKRVLAYSSIAASKEKPGAYGATKKEAEGILTASGLEVTIFRPAMVLGKGGVGLQTIIKQVQKFPGFVPLIGSGKALYQPVWIKDMVTLTAEALWNNKSYGKIYTVGGAEALPFKELVTLVKKELGVHKVLLPIPFPLAEFIAKVLEWGLKNPPFTLENVRNLRENTPVDIQPLQENFNFVPAPLKQVLPLIFEEMKLKSPKQVQLPGGG